MRHVPVQLVNIHGQPIDTKEWRKAQAEQALRSNPGTVPAKRKPTVKNGYAAQPGTGPEGKTCKTCEFKVVGGNPGGSKRFLKCELRKATWTGGEGTDILARSPACSKYEPIKEQPHDN